MFMIANIKIGITGLPEAGKTFALRAVLNMLKEENVVDDGRHRTGFTVRDLLTGEIEQFASVDYESKITVGRIGVDIGKFEPVAVAAIKNACESADIIVIDEVGKMEVESEAFVKAVREALEVDKPMIITLHKKSRNPLLQDIRRRDDVRILEVTQTNRNLLPYKVKSLMNGEKI